MESLRDQRAKAKILSRVRCLIVGNFGDARSVGADISELRIDYGPGYGVYYSQIGLEIVLLLCDGDKPTQAKDIELAKILAKNIAMTRW